MKYQVQHTQKKFRGRAFDVRQDDVILPDGKTTRLDIVEHAPAVTIIPIDTDGEIWFVRQYRHPASLELLELPAGVLETGEDPLVCAQREIQEEIGMAANTMRKIGTFFLAPGYSTEFMHVFLAKELFPSSLPHDDDEFLTIERLKPDQVANMIRDGRILDAKTLAALYLAGIGLPTEG
jgi:ADP-ribose pyrophosphatase